MLFDVFFFLFVIFRIGIFSGMCEGVIGGGVFGGIR